MWVWVKALECLSTYTVQGFARGWKVRKLSADFVCD